MPFGGAPKCSKCGKSVYATEEVQAIGLKFHKACLRCETCSKVLTTNNLCDKDGKTYCDPCHKKNFGMKGYGFGGGAGALAMDSKGGSLQTSPPAKQTNKGTKLAGKFGGGDKCCRCAKTVYAAEKWTGPGGIFHKTCFSCVTCKKNLTSGDFVDKENQIYCTPCHSKSFGPKGYGYGGGAGTLTNTT